MILFRTLVVVWILVASMVPAWARPALSDGFDAFVQQAMKDYGVPGAAVAIIENGQVTHLKGYGVLRSGQPQAVDSDTIFQLASVTKTFTAALVGTAVDAGKMGWDTPIVDTLPEMQLAEPFATERVTARDFLSHRSGLQAFTGDLFDNLGYSRADVIRRIRYMPLVNGFRNRPGYSNVGYFLAGEAAARTVGASWEDAMRSRIIDPLKLTRTGFFGGTVTSGSNIAWPHMKASQPLDAYDPQSVLAPAGLMTSSISDMARYVTMLLNGGQLDGLRIVSEKSVREMFEPVIAEEIGFADLPPISEETGFSFTPGWAAYYYNGTKVVEKGGARAGMRSVVTLMPSKGVGVVVLCNLNINAFPEAVRARVLEAAAGPLGYDVQKKLREQQQKLDAMFAQVTALPTGAPPRVAPLSASLDNLAQDYESPLYGRLRIRKSGDHLTWRLGPADYGSNLWTLGHTTFQMVQPPGKISLPGTATFVVDEKGQPTELQTEDFGSFSRVKKP